MLDDDSGKLGEIVELFSDMTPAIKVDKLIKVRYSHGTLYNKQRFPHCIYTLATRVFHGVHRSVDVGVKSWRVFQSHVMI